MNLSPGAVSKTPGALDLEQGRSLGEGPVDEHWREGTLLEMRSELSLMLLWEVGLYKKCQESAVEARVSPGESLGGPPPRGEGGRKKPPCCVATARRGG